ncbi:TfuA-like protein [Pandoraea pneumonica]|uniref:TfuA-like protein n=1 Tax=Pandoraea pneumonica TaxID=2508299 RepID=UPI003CF8C878
MAKTIEIFAGPSLFGTGLSTKTTNEVSWRPPARRGDIEHIVSTHESPGIIGLVDGTFHSYPSVGHVELREALEAGWRIYGLCSIGAIRASEMVHMGMIPWGNVAAMFCHQHDLADDEVALVHGTEAPYLPLSEPMLHLREFCRQAEGEKLLTGEQVEKILNSLKERWYGDRTIDALRFLLSKYCGDGEILNRLLFFSENFKPYQLKQADLVDFLVAQPWMSMEDNA